MHIVWRGNYKKQEKLFYIMKNIYVRKGYGLCLSIITSHSQWKMSLINNGILVCFYVCKYIWMFSSSEHHSGLISQASPSAGIFWILFPGQSLSGPRYSDWFILCVDWVTCDDISNMLKYNLRLHFVYQFQHDQYWEHLISVLDKSFILGLVQVSRFVLNTTFKLIKYF